MPGVGYSHHRLFLAMGVSSVLLMALLWILSVLIRFIDCDSATCVEQKDGLTIRLEVQEDETVPASRVPEHQAPLAPPAREAVEERQLTDTGEHEIDVGDDESILRSGEPSPTRDWSAVARASAAHFVNAQFEGEEVREKMWRQTGSLMFADTGEFDVHEPTPIIADREFRVPVGVLGVGITIGGCFIGIPLAGIPVEERTVGPNVIYCKDIYE